VRDMKRALKATGTPIGDVLELMRRLRAPDGCPWDREQDHHTLRRHAIEEVYELLDAIEADDEHEMIEELGDLLLQIVFHCQLGRERGAFDFETVCRRLVEKLVRRHPHVFGDLEVKEVDQVLTNWERIKRAEKHGTRHQRDSALDGIPRHLPALARAEKLVKKAHKAKLLTTNVMLTSKPSKTALARELFALARYSQERGWSAEELLAAEVKRQEARLRREEGKLTAKR
jgi:uncharacterized protein YabN with tetrapyrrole methylase and pyrophosphatase domain